MYLLFCGVLPRAQTKANGSSMSFSSGVCHSDGKVWLHRRHGHMFWTPVFERVSFIWRTGHVVVSSGRWLCYLPRHKHPFCSSRICRTHVLQTIIIGVTMDQYSSGPYVVAESQWRTFWFVLANAGLWRPCPGCSRKDRFLCKQTASPRNTWTTEKVQLRCAMANILHIAVTFTSYQLPSINEIIFLLSPCQFAVFVVYEHVGVCG